ncbi:MAG: outer membrane receptor protein involved in Fe transport [Candidatus Azotimanducaceae bacterium]|jgi:outer membrane receptor protein involved in Fe transport
MRKLDAAKSAIYLTGAALLLAIPAYGQDDDRPDDTLQDKPSLNFNMEEVVVLGRLRSAAESLQDERMNEEVVTDVLGAEMMSRVGDSTVAMALRRVSGLSLVGDKFVYVRGLGERYSNTLLNGATVPSPDLTRNVIPLDVFPTSIVESLRVQKTYSADMPANFGGGSVDIRTKGVPDAFTYSLEVGLGGNNETDGDVISYSGGGDDDWGTDDGTRELPGSVANAIQRFRGQLNTQSIFSTLQQEGDGSATFAEAQLLNRQLATALNRNLSIRDESASPDLDLKASIGNNWFIGDQWEFGILGSGSYKNKWRQSTQISRNFIFPVERTDTEVESTYSVELSTSVNMGLKYTDDHELTTTSLYLRNTDDETAINDFFNENREKSDGSGFRGYRITYEERDLTVNQITGKHYLGAATRELLPFGADLLKNVPEDLQFDWFISDAVAETDIPNEVNVQAQNVTDPLSGEVLSTTVGLDTAASSYRFTELRDEVKSWGWTVTLPILLANSDLKLSGGYYHARKGRSYEQYQFNLGVLSVDDPAVLQGGLGDVFSDANILDTSNNFTFDTVNSNSQSYIAATITDAYFGKIDWRLNDSWRVSAGARWEDYRQVALDLNLLGFSVTNPVITNDPVALERASFQNDDIYPSLSVTYTTEWWAEVFQLRFGYSETSIRPDLREINDATYVDPLTGDLVDGNPGIIPSSVENIDIRAEWFFESDANLTVSLFYKDITDPIELFEAPASDTTILREIVNAESAELKGVEFAGMKNLGFIGKPFEPFFIQANATILDSELVAGVNADAPTNTKRELANASDYVANVILGFDSMNAEHSATLVYNVFGERLYVAGRNGAPDAFEQPFHSFDMTYSWYPTDSMTLKFKLQNMLNAAVEIEREGVVIFEEEKGLSYSLSFQYSM